MEFSASGRIVLGPAPILALLLLFGSPAAAQSPKNSGYLGNIELCNGSGRTSIDLRINACTALIESGQLSTAALAVAYNNRGNAYASKGDDDRAIPNFDEAIKF